MERAVVSAAEGAIYTLLGKLGAILVQEAQLLGGVRGELQYLKDELESMTAFLQDLAERDEHRKQVKIWKKQVREIAYDVEDCIDEFKHQLGDNSSGDGSGFAAFFHKTIRILQTTRVRHQIAKQIQELKMHTMTISDRNSKYSVNHLNSGAAGISMGANDTQANLLNIDTRITALFPERKLVGIEPRQENLMQWLLDEHVQQLRVVSIFGFGGLGKTTLAVTTYQSLAARNGPFQYQAFVTVSQSFDVKVLMRDILLQITLPVYQQGRHASRASKASMEDLLKGMEAWDVGQLSCILRQQLENKRYLIVLDDIWSITAWEGIRFPLPDSNNGSRVVVTTRIRDVAHTCCFHEYDRTYEIEPLTDCESRDLFFKRIFGSTSSESYFDEFINRSIIQPITTCFTGKVKTFRVHDMMLEIIVSKSVEENFITLVEITVSTSHSISELGKLPRLRKLGVLMFVDDDSIWASLVSALENLSGSLCSLLLWRPDGAINFAILDSLSRPPIFMKSMNLRGQLRKLPKWFPLLSNLTELTLRATELSAKEDLKLGRHDLKKGRYLS
ncbi:hypothetical protein ABZP36_002097 [Zizania latifolia]